MCSSATSNVRNARVLIIVCYSVIRIRFSSIFVQFCLDDETWKQYKNAVKRIVDESEEEEEDQRFCFSNGPNKSLKYWAILSCLEVRFNWNKRRASNGAEKVKWTIISLLISETKWTSLLLAKTNRIEALEWEAISFGFFKSKLKLNSSRWRRNERRDDDGVDESTFEWVEWKQEKL